MCGIAGTYPEKDRNFIEKSIGLLDHRGPDDNRIVDASKGTLGHTRLAIIDVSGGHQPMRENQHLITFNGQIYNFRQLRQSLSDRLTTDSDTEVILKLYKAHGPNCVALLDGMFAFAIMDGENLFLARDHLGIKPLYYAIKKGRLFFASEMKALLRLAGEILEFPPGHWWHSQYGLKQYYQLPRGTLFEETPDRSPEPGDLSKIRREIRRAVHKRLIADADVPIGVSLSGGLDSSIVAALAREVKDRLDTFVIGTPDSTDIPASQHMAAFLGTRHHVYQYTFEEMLDVLPEVIYHLESFDAPLVRSAIPNYFLAKLASDHVKVLLTGEGADELYAGYEYLKPVQDANELDSELVHLTSKLHNTNLQRADRMTMAHGLEGRVPFLDMTFVDMSMALPAEWKLHREDWPEKALLRRSFSALLPGFIADRPKAKLSRGAGSMDLMASYAHDTITDVDFASNRVLSPLVSLQSKEEMLYYQIFRNIFGDQIPLESVGRTHSITNNEVI